MRNKILSLLVLLLTAASGAWAEETLLTTITGAGSNTNPATSANVSYSTEGVATLTFSEPTPDGQVAYYVSPAWGWWGYAITLTVTPAEGYTITKCVFYDNENLTATDSEAPFVVETVWDDKTPKVNGTILSDYSKGITKIEVYGYVTPTVPIEPDVEVTTNAEEGETTFTEASFAMPAYDATAEYELVRDMDYGISFSGVPTRARLAKDGNGKFHFADGLTFQLLDNIDANNPKDITKAEGITFMVGEMVPYDFDGHTYYQLDKETLVPLADFLADAQPGLYAIRAVASNGEYDGIFTSDVINLFMGYEVEVAAKEFVTYFRDEPLYADPQTSPDAELYTLSKVEGDQVVLSSKADVIPSNVPMLVYNNSDEDKTFLLIPADEEPVSFMWLRFFVGTLEPTTIPASTANLTNYALNGKQFVWVKDAIEVGDHKAWLSIENSTSNARALNIVFEDETTSISLTPSPSPNGEGSIYTLDGRKIAKPTKKGIYILNGKKVVK